MKIIEKENIRISIVDVRNGEVIKYEDQYFMKIIKDDTIFKNEGCPVIRLIDGQLITFDSLIQVEVINAELNIKGIIK